MSTFKAPSAGSEVDTLQVTALDFTAAISQTVSAPGADFVLAAGLYTIVASADFSFAHASASDIGDVEVRAPWFANVYLTLYLDTAQTLRVDVASGSAEVVVIPARTYA